MKRMSTANIISILAMALLPVTLMAEGNDAGWELRAIENTLSTTFTINQFQAEFLHRRGQVDVPMFCNSANVSAFVGRFECSAFEGWEIGEFRDFDGIFLLTSPVSEIEPQQIAFAYRQFEGMVVRGPIDLPEPNLYVETRDGDGWVAGEPCPEGYQNTDIRFLKMQFNTLFILLRSSTQYSCVGFDSGHIDYTSNGAHVVGSGGMVGEKLTNFEIYTVNR